MNAKEAVAIAKGYVAEIFGDENPENIGLEEIVYEPANEEWKITIGFSRPWNISRNAFATLTGDVDARREFKVLTIRDQDREVIALTAREAA